VNGIPVFDEPWKNVVATFYHELNEARTDADVEDAIRAGNDGFRAHYFRIINPDGHWPCGTGSACYTISPLSSSKSLEGRLRLPGLQARRFASVVPEILEFLATLPQ